MDQLVGIRVFCTVVELKSFIAAAERLDMSATMVSKHVKQLERRLTTRLLNRTSRATAKLCCITLHSRAWAWCGCRN